MSTFCKKAMAQGPVIVARFMGRYPPTARSVYKPPTSEEHHATAAHNKHLSSQQHVSHWSSLLVSSCCSVDLGGNRVCTSECSCSPPSYPGLDELLSAIQDFGKSMENSSEKEDLTAFSVILLINELVMAGRISPAVYLLLLKFFLLQRTGVTTAPSLQKHQTFSNAGQFC